LWAFVVVPPPLLGVFAGAGDHNKCIDSLPTRRVRLERGEPRIVGFRQIGGVGSGFSVVIPPLFGVGASVGNHGHGELGAAAGIVGLQRDQAGVVGFQIVFERSLINSVIPPPLLGIRSGVLHVGNGESVRRKIFFDVDDAGILCLEGVIDVVESLSGINPPCRRRAVFVVVLGPRRQNGCRSQQAQAQQGAKRRPQDGLTCVAELSCLVHTEGRYNIGLQSKHKSKSHVSLLLNSD